MHWAVWARVRVRPTRSFLPYPLNFEALIIIQEPVLLRRFLCTSQVLSIELNTYELSIFFCVFLLIASLHAFFRY